MVIPYSTIVMVGGWLCTCVAEGRQRAHPGEKVVVVNECPAELKTKHKQATVRAIREESTQIRLGQQQQVDRCRPTPVYK